MTAMERGSSVISCRQIEVDGLRILRPGDMSVGAAWRWTGQATAVEAARDLPLLAKALGEVDVRRRAARQVRRMLAPVLETALDDGSQWAPSLAEPPLGTDGVLSVSDGFRTFTAVLVGTGAPRGGYAVFAGRMPPARTDLRVTGLKLRCARAVRPQELPGFPAGTPIATVTGSRRVENLRPGDLIETRDGPPRPLLWIGDAAMAVPNAVRLGPNVFGPGIPLAPAVLAPGQGVLVRHPSARALFGVGEVLVPARDLVEPGFARFCTARGRQYHLLLETPQVIWAADVPCASLHAAALVPTGLPDSQRLALLAAAPELYKDPASHGPAARRALNAPEAALMFQRPKVSRLGG